MIDFFKFILSTRSALGSLNKKELEKIIFILSRAFPPDNPRLALKRFINLFITYIAWKKGIIINNLKPVILEIESVKGCNFNCIMCKAGEMEKKFLDIDKLKKIIDLFPETMVVIFSWIGEPFLSRDLLDMIRYMSFERKILVTLFSNMSVLPDPAEVINSGLYEINASIDSFNPEKFSKIREWGNLDKVISNLKKLISTRNKLNKKIPIISINALSSKETMDDAEDIIKNAIELGIDKVRFSKLAFKTPELTEPDEDDFKYLKHLKQKYGGKIRIQFDNFRWTDDRQLVGYCFFVYFASCIDVSGNMYPCWRHQPIIKGVTFGNIFSDKFAKIKDRRKKLLRNFREEMPDFCSDCVLYMRKHV